MGTTTYILNYDAIRYAQVQFLVNVNYVPTNYNILMNTKYINIWY